MPRRLTLQRKSEHEIKKVDQAENNEFLFEAKRQGYQNRTATEIFALIKLNHKLGRVGSDTDGSYWVPDDLVGINVRFLL